MMVAVNNQFRGVEMSDYYFAIVFLTYLLLIVTLLFACGNRLMSKKNKIEFFCIISVLLVTSSSEFLGVLLNGADPSLRGLHIFVKFLELSCAPIIGIIFGDVYCKIEKKLLPIILFGTHCVIEFFSMFFGYIFYVDEQNIYHHGPFYFIYYIAYTVSFIFLISQIYKFAMKYQDQKTLELVAISLFIISGVICQAVFGSLRIVWLTVSIGFFMFYAHYNSILNQVDSLTGLLNRRFLDREIASVRKRCVVIFFDIDGFKNINDTYGHKYGDTCLINTARIIKKSFSKVGYSYRYGGDELCVLMNKDVDNVQKYIENCIENLQVHRNNSKTVFPYVSVGYSLYNVGDDIEKIVENADKNMYLEKRYKKNTKTN